MMRQKRWILWLISAVFLALCGCGKEEEKVMGIAEQFGIA